MDWTTDLIEAGLPQPTLGTSVIHFREDAVLWRNGGVDKESQDAAREFQEVDGQGELQVWWEDPAAGCLSGVVYDSNAKEGGVG